MPRTPTRHSPRARHGSTVYERLRQLIIQGRLAPGARLVELDLADLLGVSRTPVREAMVRLVQEGFARPVRASARAQLIVAPLTQADLHDLYTIMGALEGAAARYLARIDPAGRSALASAMAKANQVFERVGRESPRDFRRMFETHNAFHALLVERCATMRLRALIEQVQPHVDRYEYLYAGLVGPDYSQTFVEHRAMVQAVRSGTPSRAEQAVRANWLNGARRLAAAVARVPSLGDFAGGLSQA
jgi:DNA-binding GntR family transcriptional regulator